MKYAMARFDGKKLGAIGISSRYQAVTRGETEGDMYRNLYDRFEHISGVSLVEISPEEYLRLKTLETAQQSGHLEIIHITGEKKNG